MDSEHPSVNIDVVGCTMCSPDNNTVFTFLRRTIRVRSIALLTPEQCCNKPRLPLSQLSQEEIEADLFERLVRTPDIAPSKMG